MKDRISESIAGLNDSAKQYINARLDLYKLLLLKKTTQSMSFLFGLLIAILIATVILIFAGAAFTLWYGKTFDNYYAGALMVIGFFLFLAVMILIFRRKILNRIFLKNISEILYEENELEKE
jgi:hypothetical protein